MTRLSRRTLLGSSAAAAGLGLAGGRLRAQEKIKVAAVHASPVENAWNSRLHDAMTTAEQEGRIEYSFSESVSGTDYARAMREYADQGARLIVGESYAVEREAREVAKDYPDTGFLMGSSGEAQGENFGVFGTWNHEAGYLTGMLAARMSETGVYGSVGGYPIPEVNRLINAFRDGVRAVRGDEAEFLVAFIGAWFDPAKAKEAGLAQIDAGADILFGERIGTADAAAERGKFAIGSLINYIPRYPDVVFANAMWYFGPILEAALRDVDGGAGTGKDYSEYSFLEHGGNDIVFKPEMVPADITGDMEERRVAIKIGDFKVPIDDSKPT